MLIYGKYLDFFTDVFYWFSLISIWYYYTRIHYIIIVYLYYIYQIYSFVVNGDEIFINNKINKFLHDNTI